MGWDGRVMPEACSTASAAPFSEATTGRIQALPLEWLELLAEAHSAAVSLAAVSDPHHQHQ